MQTCLTPADDSGFPWGAFPFAAVVVALTSAIWFAEPIARAANQGWHPGSNWTWLILIGNAMWLIAALVIENRVPVSVVLFAQTVIFCILSSCIDGDVHIYDLARGREGFSHCSGMQYSGPGRNTALLDRYLGPAPPKWFSREYDKRTLPIFAYSLAECLDCVPEPDRCEVLRALASPNNLLVYHQTLILRCYNALRKKTPRDEWWKKHRQLFVIVQDPKQAAILSNNWLYYPLDRAIQQIEFETHQKPEELRAHWEVCKRFEEEQHGWGAEFAQQRMRVSFSHDRAPLSLEFGEP